MHQHTDEMAREIGITAQRLRIDVLKMVMAAQAGHLGGPFSAAEIVASLYFHQLRIDPSRPEWHDRDRFLLSKGHAAPLLYAALQLARGVHRARRVKKLGRIPDGGGHRVRGRSHGTTADPPRLRS